MTIAHEQDVDIRTTRSVDEIVWRKDLYPRFEPNPQTIQQYAESIEHLPPIEINQHNELIDGYHRWTAHKTAKVERVPVTITETASDAEFLVLAIRRNAQHGLQLTSGEKERMARRIYETREIDDKRELARLLAVSYETIRTWVERIDERRQEDREQTIFDMWLRCETQQSIADAVGLSPGAINANLAELSDLQKSAKLKVPTVWHQNEGWHPQLYSIWSFAKNDNEIEHFGNTHVGIVDNLLYLYTQPFDIVIDPFGGGGSTIDICKRRLRRYWVSDMSPVPARSDIRQHDIVADGVGGPARGWDDVKLVYLDPPYWIQARGEYSDSPNNLANMDLETFTRTLVDLIHGYARKMAPGAHIACIISPTQWPNENHENVYHDIDLACRVQKRVKLVQRIVCPYSTQQYNGNMVDIAKRDKLVLAIDRTMLIWEVVG